MIMEYIEGGTLNDYVKERGGKLSEEEVRDLITPIV